MCIKRLENILREHARERDRKGQLGLLPLDIYDALEETIPHGLVIELGEIIAKLRGAGN